MAAIGRMDHVSRPANSDIMPSQGVQQLKSASPYSHLRRCFTSSPLILLTVIRYSRLFDLPVFLLTIMRFSTLFGAATVFATLGVAAPTQGGPSAVFHVTKFETAYNPETEKTDMSFHISGTSRWGTARFAGVTCSASSAKKTSGEIHPIEFSLCKADDDVRFQLVEHEDGWAFKVIHLRFYYGPKHHPYDSAMYVIPKEDINTVHDGKKSYQSLGGSDSFDLKAHWNLG
jgi:hypothetical protein